MIQDLISVFILQLTGEYSQIIAFSGHCLLFSLSSTSLLVSHSFPQWSGQWPGRTSHRYLLMVNCSTSRHQLTGEHSQMVHKLWIGRIIVCFVLSFTSLLERDSEEIQRKN